LLLRRSVELERGGRASENANAAGWGVSPQNLRPNAPRNGVTRGDATS
jgi:hypothetical protein